MLKSFVFADTTYFRSWWAVVGKTMSALRPDGRTCTWTTTSRQKNWPNTCVNWTRTTSSTTNTSGGRAPVSLSTQSSSAGCARCCTMTARQPNTTGTSTTGGVARACATMPCRGDGSLNRQWTNSPKSNWPVVKRTTTANSIYRRRRPQRSTWSPATTTTNVANDNATPVPVLQTTAHQCPSLTFGGPAAPRQCQRSRGPRDGRRTSPDGNRHRHRRTCACQAPRADVAGAAGRTCARRLPAGMS